MNDTIQHVKKLQECLVTERRDKQNDDEDMNKAIDSLIDIFLDNYFSKYK